MQLSGPQERWVPSNTQQHATTTGETTADIIQQQRRLPLSPLGHRRLAGSVITLEYTFLEYTNHASKSRIGASASYLSSDKCCKCVENMGEGSQAHTRDRWKFSHDAKKYVHFDTVKSEFSTHDQNYWQTSYMITCSFLHWDQRFQVKAAATPRKATTMNSQRRRSTMLSSLSKM